RPGCKEDLQPAADAPRGGAPEARSPRGGAAEAGDYGVEYRRSLEFSHAKFPNVSPMRHQNKGANGIAVFTSEQITRKKPARFQTGTGANALGSAGAPTLSMRPRHILKCLAVLALSASSKSSRTSSCVAAPCMPREPGSTRIGSLA